VETDKEEVFAVYPNPASDKITITSSTTQSLRLSICNILGELILRRTLSGNTNEIDISSMAKGVYILNVSGKDWIGKRKMVKE
jgi:hypothetical protein